MTIYINGKYLTQRLTGVQRYAFEITKGLLALGADVKVIIPSFLDTNKIDLPSHVLLPLKGFRNTNLWEQITIARFLRDKKDSILLNLCNIGSLFIKNQIICIHDMTYRVNPKWFSRAFSGYYEFMIPRLARTAKELITVSEFSKNEISEHLQVNKASIAVVYNAPADQFVCERFEHIKAEKEDFFLFVGSMHPRKNINLIIELFSLPAFELEKLVVVGAKTKDFAKVNFDLPANVRVLNTCEDDQLAHLYCKAKALLNPSVYEGFGLPVVEAMASGCPLIISDIEVFREIALDGAFYFDPYSLESLKTAVQNFLRQSQEQKLKNIHTNFLRSKMFSWENSSRKLLDVINK